jgi:hypothetical protein
MNPKILLCLALILSGGLQGATVPAEPPRATLTEADQTLTKQISNILLECQKIKPGMTRTELMKVFETEGGLYTATQQTFVYRHCPYVKVDVEFTLSDPRQNLQNLLEGQPTDTISKISKPYLEWSITD